MQLLYFRNAHTEPYSAPYSHEIHRLISFCQAENRHCVSVDWGTHNQILSFVGVASRATRIENLSAELDPQAYFVSFRDGLTAGTRRRALLWQRAHEKGWALEAAPEWGQHSLTFEVFKVRH